MIDSIPNNAPLTVPQPMQEEKPKYHVKADVVYYAKTRPVFEGYKTAKYIMEYPVEHEARIVIYLAEQGTFRHLLSVAKLH